MKRTRYTQSQIIDKLRLAEQLAAEGKTGAAIAKQLDFPNKPITDGKEHMVAQTRHIFIDFVN